MSVNLPKQKQIRLPFSVSKPGRTKASKRVCGICRKHDSEYTCPRCNIPYCSLACFKDQSHVQCSEPFYKSTVMDQIAIDPKAGMDEKKKMMEMLRRFEDAQAGDEEALAELDGAEDESEDELEKALADIDLDDIDSNRLFHLLPQEHRDAFLAALRDPESKEAKELLDSAVKDDVPDMPDVLPWWEESLDDEEENELEVAQPPSMTSEEVTNAIKPPSGVGRKLIYNVLSLALAYLHILLSSRLPSLDQQYLSSGSVSVDEVKNDFGQFLPFLVDAKSTVRYESVREAWTDVWERIGRSIDPPPSSDLLIRLLSILPPLLHPSIMIDTPPRILLLLSDVYNLFARPKPGAAVPRKVAFYLAALKQLSREDWLGLEREVQKEVEKLQEENQVDEREEEEPERPALKL